jgi:hypothetical protein
MRFSTFLRFAMLIWQNTAGEGVGLQFEFSGGSSLRLLTDDIDITLADLDAGSPDKFTASA